LIVRRIRFDSAHARPVTSSAAASIRPLEPGHAPSRCLGAVFRYPSFSRACAAWPDAGSFPLQMRPAALLGFQPFAGLLPHPGSRSFLIVRAHVPLTSAPPAPIHFRRGDQPPVEKGDLKERMAWGDVDLASGLRSRLRSVSDPDFSRPDRACLGLCLLQGCGRCAQRIRTGSIPRESSSPNAVGWRPIRSWVWATLTTIVALRRAAAEFTTSPA